MVPSGCCQLQMLLALGSWGKGQRGQEADSGKFPPSNASLLNNPQQQHSGQHQAPRPRASM